jgi:hypothetical protein
MNSVSKKSSKLFQTLVALIMIAGLLFPPSTVVKAQDPIPPATGEAIPETPSEEQTAESPAELTPLTDSSQQETVEAPIDTPSVEQTVESPADPAQPVDLTQQQTIEAPVDTNPSELSPTDPGELVLQSQETLPEVVEAMQGVAAVLIDSEGEVVPLASQLAAEILADGDPIIERGGITYSFLTNCGSVANCTQSTTPVSAAVAFAEAGETIKIAAGTYNEDISINKNITLKGVQTEGSNGVGNVYISTVRLFSDISDWTNIFVNNVFVNPGANIQDGVDIVQTGGTVNVAPGDYEEEAVDRTVNGGPAKYQFGIYVGTDKNGITIQGLKADGTPVTKYSEAAALIKTNATNNFGYSGIFVEGNNVTLSGLIIGDNKPSNNKTIEIMGDNFTLKNSQIVASDGGSVYFNDWNYDSVNNISSIKSYTIDGNLFAYGGSLDISSGAGYSGPVTGRRIVNNVFDGEQMDGTDAYWSLTSFNGKVPSIGWYVNPVGGAVISDNTYNNSSMYIRSRGAVDDASFDWQSYWNNNNFDHAAITLQDVAGFDVREYSYTSGSYFIDNVRRIGSSIQSEIDNVAQDGDKVLLSKGTFVENVIINKSLEVAGAGADKTFITPATSKPDCGSSSLCTGASNILLVQANDVTIHDMTLDGNNPNLSSGIVRNDVDIDARNGIITNHAVGLFNNLDVFNTVVKNIFLRGIYASSGGTFNIHDNVVDNVMGNSSSIAMMNYNGAGIFSNNKVTNSNDGIVSNWSRGTQYLYNTVINSGTGIHTDNYAPLWGSAPLGPELIQNNSVKDSPNGYGIFVFAPFGQVTVDSNLIEKVAVGLAASGSNTYTAGTPGGSSIFSNNHVNGGFLTDNIGAFITTDLWGWGYAPVSTFFINNVILNNETGFYLEDQETPWNSGYTYNGPYGVDINATHNAIVNNTTDVSNLNDGNAEMLDNWWNNNNGPQNIAGQADTTTWLKLGLTANPNTINAHGSSNLTSNMYSSGDQAESQVTDLKWFKTTEISNAEETVFGSLVNNIFTAGSSGGKALFSSTFFGKIFNSLAFIDILANLEPGSNGTDDGVLPAGGGLNGGFIPAGGAGVGGLIPVTGGMNKLSCTAANSLVLPNGSQVAFSDPLCDFEANLTEEKADSLPGDLPAGMIFGDSFTLVVQKSGISFDVLPSPVTLSLSFAVPAELQGKTFTILYWDASLKGGLGDWVEIPAKVVVNETDVTVQLADGSSINSTGLFVLTAK